NDDTSLSVDLSLNTLTYKNKLIDLQQQEAQILHYLLCNKGKTVSRNDLSFAAKGCSYDGWTRSIDISISKIRKKLNYVGAKSNLILTVRGKGYHFKLDDIK
ncbi:winged helix-turn-helix domain-containing protein, partial [Vibrio sp. FNV 38]|nr:winged helix-turn-helix domain-containing protein [Vibrio sp. FNV 38]